MKLPEPKPTQQCPHGFTLEDAWTPPGCPDCLAALSAELDELELDDPFVRDAAIRLQDTVERLFGDEST